MSGQEKLKAEMNRWKETTLHQATQRFPERKKRFETTSQVELKGLYTPIDHKEENYIEDLGFPGEFPFTRGVRPTMHRGRLWTMRMYSGFASAEETNKRYKYLLEAGQTGLSVAFHLPTQIGYDSDNPMAEGEVGRVGVAVDTLADMEKMFEGIPLDKVSTNMTINSTAIIILAMYLVVADKQGVRFEDCKGTIQNDILKEYVARGTYIYPPKESMRITGNIFSYCQKYVPKWNTISICGYHIREAGSNAVQEAAFTLANAIAYVQAGIDEGLDVDDFAPRISFHFDTHNNFLEEVAKYRAARRLWARIMKERFKAKKPASCMLRAHSQGAGCTLTRQQPENNVIRVTIQALAGVLGGALSLQTNSQDEAYAIPTEATVRTALRTQQIIAHESGVADFVDPLGGSYAIEALTSEIETEAIGYIKKIDGMGGAAAAIEKGFIQSEIAESAYQYQKAIESKMQVVVGVNDYVVEESAHINTTQIDAKTEKIQINKLQKIKSQRNQSKVDQAVSSIKKAAKGHDNLMPSVIAAVKEYATVGEISDVLREVFGEYQG